ncbi:MAG: hypothetical protein KGL51_14730 [Betaproteobacteria bacterium]|nr:hypothetical protein [Betaproteobacteria bacterium]MDE2124711.1 hypothetical protein [Betaproteobacteria bacterium]MDE2186980.1 hypothetical protein [Betaproteobacteria bacterium]MDE2325904.1 hypothetical protein [Betaproteobacteria bacterium]
MTTLSALLGALCLALYAASAAAQTTTDPGAMGGMHHPASAAAGMMKQGEPMNMKKRMVSKEKKMRQEGMMNKDAAGTAPMGHGSQ